MQNCQVRVVHEVDGELGGACSSHPDTHVVVTVLTDQVVQRAVERGS